MPKETILTPSEIEILKLGAEDPSIVTDYFFRPEGMDNGFRFDENFTEEGAWQKTVHKAKQRDITIIGGFGTGKTVGVGMSACVWALSMHDFKFLNVAPKVWQAKLMFDAILTNARNTRFEDLIWERRRAPHPKITLRFRIGNILYESSLEFMSADKDATGILSWEGDWLHVDESGLLDNLEEVIINAGSRLRGAVRGRSRLGRFSMASNSWDNFALWSYFDQAVADPDNFLSIVVSSRDNKNITEDQLARMVARIPEDERERFIDGTRPEGRGWYFAKDRIYECEDPVIGEYVEEQVKAEKHGFALQRLHGAGVTYLTMPARAGRLIMVFGDPGVDAAPKRNAPVIGAWDVTDFPFTPARLISFWWGNGGGRITPFVNKLFDFMDWYKPIYVGIDATGTQKNMNFLLNEHLFRDRFQIKEMIGDEEVITHGYMSPIGIIKGIMPMDFSGNMKQHYLQAARLLIEGGLLTWPKVIVGFRSQLSNYDPEKDKKIAQDIVAMTGMSAYGIRKKFHTSLEDVLAERTSQNDQLAHTARRLSNAARNRRSSRIRQETVYYQEQA